MQETTISRLKAKWKNKNLFGKITDLLVIVFIILLFIPQSRLAIGGFINRVKAMIVSPSELPKEQQEMLSLQDYNWEMTDLEGNKHFLSEAKNKVIFINIWATWCPPCVGEMPEIQSLWDKFKDNPEVKFFLVSNENLETIKNFMEKRDYDFPVYSSKYSPPEKLKSSTIPVSFIISKQGKIVVRETGASKWGGEKVEALIKKLITSEAK